MKDKKKKQTKKLDIKKRKINHFEQEIHCVCKISISGSGSTVRNFHFSVTFGLFGAQPLTLLFRLLENGSEMKATKRYLLSGVSEFCGRCQEVTNSSELYKSTGIKLFRLLWSLLGTHQYLL